MAAKNVVTIDGAEVTIKQPNNEYWTKRSELSTQRAYRTGDKSMTRLQRLYKLANAEMSKEISDFYTKYGADRQSPIFTTLDDGTEVMTGSTTKRVVPQSEAMKYGRIDSLQKQLNVILSELAVDQKGYMTTELREIAQDAYYNQFYTTFKGYGVGYRFDLLDPKVVTQMINHPVMGQNFSKRVWNNKRLLANRVNQELRNGITQGISTREMSKRLASKMDSGYKVAERLMRTEITNTYNQATLQGYKDSGIVDQYEYYAYLDNRTSEVCTRLDGKKFKLEDAVTGLNYPPMHVNCRSTTVPDFNDKEFLRVVRDPNTKQVYRFNDKQSFEDWKSNNFKA